MLPKIDNFFKKNNNDTKMKVPKISPEFDFKMNFDGCSKGNPGLAGAGAVIYKHDKEKWCDHFFVGVNYTNNHAEYAGLILGLQQAKAMGIKHLRVEGDSLLVINHMKGVYKCKSINLLDLYEKAKELVSHFDEIEFVHVFRNKNKRADQLSNMAIDSYMDNSNNMNDCKLETCSNDSIIKDNDDSI
jgi:ribonuclease HI